MLIAHCHFSWTKGNVEQKYLISGLLMMSFWICMSKSVNTFWFRILWNVNWLLPLILWFVISNSWKLRRIYINTKTFCRNFKENIPGKLFDFYIVIFLNNILRNIFENVFAIFFLLYTCFVCFSNIKVDSFMT